MTLRLTDGRIFTDWESARPRRAAARYAAAAGLVAAATVLGLFWAAMPDPRNLALLFFAAILISGVWLGVRPALFAAAIGFVTYDFLLVKPRYAFHFSPADVLALAIFIAGALIVGGLAGLLRDRARDANNRLRDLRSLFEASRDLAGTIEPPEAAAHLVSHLEAVGCWAAIWIETASGLRLMCASASKLLEAAQRGPHFVDVAGGDAMLESARFPLNIGGRSLGAAVVWLRGEPGDAAPDRRWIETLLDLGAVAIDRARLMSEIAEARVVAEKEGLRTALLSSLSHDLRTPIATILASATSLQEHDAQFDAPTRREILETIQEETERLNRYVANLLEMIPFESGALQLRNALIDPGEAMASAIERVHGRLKGRHIARSFAADGVRINVDPVLMEQALVNILENALVHAPEDSMITATTATADGDVLMSIEDNGPGVAANDLDRIFDKFYRGGGDRRPSSGVGLGLSVTRGLIESFSGRLRAVSPTRDGCGTRFEIRLAAYPALETVE